MIGLPLAMFLWISDPAQDLAVPLHTSDKSITVPAAASDMAIPAHLYMPPNPAAPGKKLAETNHLKCLLAQRTTNYYHASPSQAKNIELVARRLNGILVAPGQTFSYNQHVGPYTAANGFGWGRAFDGDRIVPSMGGGVCQGASTLYSALLRTGLEIVERHNHGMTVPYLPPGEDATVAMSAHLDFRFRNNQPTPVLITAEALPEKRWLTVAVWGGQPAPEIQVRHKLLEVTPHQVVMKEDPDLLAGKTQQVTPGQDGGTVDTWLDVRKGSQVLHEYVGRDLYQSSPEVLKTGEKVPTGGSGK